MYHHMLYHNTYELLPKIGENLYISSQCTIGVSSLKTHKLSRHLLDKQLELTVQIEEIHLLPSQIFIGETLLSLIVLL